MKIRVELHTPNMIEVPFTELTTRKDAEQLAHYLLDQAALLWPNVLTNPAIKRLRTDRQKP